MDDFQTKVEHFKQTIQEPGFETEDSSPIADAPNINSGLESETPQDEVQEQIADQKPKKTSRRKVEYFRDRLDQLTFENNVKQAQNQDLLARVQEQERLLAEKQYQLEQNEQHKNAYYENNLQTREVSILNELKMAKEEGDVDKEIALSKALAQVAAEQSTYGFYKSQLKAQPPQSDYDDSSESTFYPVPTVNNNYDEPENDALDSWLEKNQWADPNSSHFSPRLRQEANALSTELDEMLRYNGSSHMIGTPEYFESLDNLMSERYAIQDAPAKQPTSNNSQYNVAPVSRNGSSMADQYISKNPNNTRQSMSLTEDEYKIARNLQIKLPNGRYATGDEAVRRYAEAKRLSNSSGSNKLIIE